MILVYALALLGLYGAIGILVFYCEVRREPMAVLLFPVIILLWPIIVWHYLR